MNNALVAEKKNQKKTKSARARVGMRRRLFFCFALFSLFTILVLWVCQIFFLDRFYYRTTSSFLSRSADRLAEAYTSAGFSSTASSIAIDGQVCICVFRVGKQSADIILTQESSVGCAAHKLRSEQLMLIYKNAANNEGEYYTEAFLSSVYDPFLNTQELRALLQDEYDGLSFAFDDDAITPSDERLLYCRLFMDGEDVVMLILDAPLSPVGAVVNTLRILLAVISVLVLLLSFLLAFVLSRQFSRPIINMSKKAASLADGRYDTDFSDNTYREVSELGQALNYASGQLSSLDRMQKELVANISHDLRTPLTMIKAYTEMMRDIEGENTPENMQVVIDETERLCELVNDILAISRHQAGVQAMEYSDFDLSLTLSQTVERYRRLKGADGFEFDLDIDGCAFVHADRSAILQVVSNLINNALNYASGKKIEISCKASDTCVRVQVKDTGEGIPERELANIWDRYYKLDKTHARSRAGSGLGLSIVRQILEAHRARYGVESTIGVGTCFWFELPLEKR